jgi:hypothetical protein
MPYLPRLKVRSTTTNREVGGPCIAVMTNLLNCWASNAHGAKVCDGLETELKTCVATVSRIGLEMSQTFCLDLN